MNEIVKLLRCPFCGHEVANDDMRDTVYPTGTYWREIDGYRSYVRHPLRQPDDNQCWQVVCQISAGGCDAHVSADSREEAIKKWNTRYES